MNVDNQGQQVRIIYLPTDEEEAEIQAIIASDPDCPELTDAEKSTAVKFDNTKTVLVEGPAPPPVVDNSNRELVYVDTDLVEYFWRDWQYWENRMNEAFRWTVFGEGAVENATRVPPTPDLTDKQRRIKVLFSPSRRKLVFIDKDLVEHFRQGGNSWEDRMNEVFRQAVLADEECRKNNGP